MLLPDGCLVGNLSQHLELDEIEIALVSSVETDEITFPRSYRIQRAGERIETLYIVRSGWLFTSSNLPDGRRLVQRVCVPGDIIGLDDIGYTHATHDLNTCNAVVLSPFSRQSLKSMIGQSPRLASLLMALSAQQHVYAMDLLRAITRMSAKERIVCLLLQLLHRLRITVGREIDGFDLPLSQTEIGDALGLTNVSVSKGLSELERAGDIRRDRGRFTLCDPAALARSVDFSNRHGDLDPNWFSR